MTQDNQGFTRTATQLNWPGLIAGQVGVAACFVGDPGGGKTETLRHLAKATNRRFIPYYLSSQIPEDLSGYPEIATIKVQGFDRKVVQYIPDERLLRATTEPSILLLDEITNCRPNKQAAALNLVQNGPANAWFYLAANDPEVASDGQPLTQPFINRIWYGSWEIDREAQDWGYTHELQYPAPNVPVVTNDYKLLLPKWGTLVTQFLNMNEAFRHQCPRKRSDMGKPFPSPRSWNNLIKVCAAAESVGATMETIEKVITGLVGMDAGAALLVHISTMDLHTAEEMVENPELMLVARDGDELQYDGRLIAVRMVIHYCKTNEVPLEKLEELGDFIGEKVGNDIAVVFRKNTMGKTYAEQVLPEFK